jgi:hypothetical protein
MTDSSIEALSARIEALEAEQEKLRDQLIQAQLDQWKGRVDDLEVQAHLGALDLQDKVQPLVEQVRNSLLDAREKATSAASAADDVVASLRKGVEKAFDDIVSAVRDARANL